MKTGKTRVALAWTICVATLGMSGCGASDGSGAFGGRGAVDQSTPEATAEGYRSRVAAGEWADAFGYLMPGAQAALVSTAVTMGTFGVESQAQAGEFGAFVAKFGLPRDPTELRGRDDLGEVFGNIVDWIEDNAPNGRAVEHFEAIKARLADAQFTDFQEAEGYARMEMVTGGDSKRMTLQRVDNRWFMETYM